MRTVRIGLVFLCLLANVTPAVSQTADPLGLISHGALLPYFGADQAGALAVLMLASPVGTNATPEEGPPVPPLHMFFFDTTCTRVGPSVGNPMTVNDAELLDLNLIADIPTSGLVAIGGVDDSGGNFVPLNSPIHARMLWINAAEDFIRVLDPIAILNAETLDTTQKWNPLRTAAAFYAGLESLTTSSTLILVCPTKAVTTAIFPPPVFPKLKPKPVGSGATTMFLRIYDDEEAFLRNTVFTCNCLSSIRLTNLDVIYSDPLAAPRGTYTEVEGGTGTVPRAFTGYLATKLGDQDMFGRLHNGSLSSLRGTLMPGER